MFWWVGKMKPLGCRIHSVYKSWLKQSAQKYGLNNKKTYFDMQSFLYWTMNFCCSVDNETDFAFIFHSNLKFSLSWKIVTDIWLAAPERQPTRRDTWGKPESTTAEILWLKKESRWRSLHPIIKHTFCYVIDVTYFYIPYIWTSCIILAKFLKTHSKITTHTLTHTHSYIYIYIYIWPFQPIVLNVCHLLHLFLLNS